MNFTMPGVGGEDPIGMDPQPEEGPASFAALISALVPTSTTGLMLLGVFILVRRRFHILYAPRSILGTVEERDRTPLPSKGFLNWLIATREFPDEFLLQHESLDAYLYLRFLRMIIFICVVGCVLTWPILMPVNFTGGGSSTELDRLSISNIEKTDYLYAHAMMACIFLGFVMIAIARERAWLINLRRAWTLSTPNAKRLSSRTVLFLSAPRDALEQKNMNRYFGESAVRIWPATKLGKLPRLISEQEALTKQLESEEATLILKANSWWARRRIDGVDLKKISLYDLMDITKTVMRLRSTPIPSLESVLAFESPFGEEVDTVKPLRGQIREKGELIEKMRRTHELENLNGPAAVFVEFKTQAEAQWAYQHIESPDSWTLTPRHIGVKPSEVVWDNLALSPIYRIVKQGIALSIVASTIVAWSIPSGLVGLVSNIGYLADHYKWLWFLKELPDTVTGLLSGLLAPILTSALTKDMPAMYRNVFESAGGPIQTVNELRVQRWFYIFQVTQVFLLTAVFSGAAAMTSEQAAQIRNPKYIVELLASQLPKSSTYYLTYFVVQGITSAANNLLDYSKLLDHLSFEIWKDETPRQKFNRYTTMKGIDWGQVYPKFANFAIIAVAYSCIAPLVLGFAAAGLSLYYMSYRYNLFYVMQLKIDTKGQAYTAALQHLLTGVYIAELVLIGFFSLRAAKGPMTIAGLLFVVTILYHVVTNRYMSPLEKALPTELNSPAEKIDETTPLLSRVEEGQDSNAHQEGQSAHAPSPVAEVSKLMAWFLNSRVFDFSKYMRPGLLHVNDYNIEEREVPEYTKEDLERAYLHPALTSRTPMVWMARDKMGASQVAVRDMEECGLKASDEGAWLDERRRVQFNEQDFEKLPVWKPVVKY
ncbi:DUF221-domain-containing protein [Xylaria nigripes]|nr:DUF221-domain-containing protein [Xylaria nigripes]